MKPSEALRRHRTEIRDVIEVNHGHNARVFGSVAKGTDQEDSVFYNSAFTVKRILFGSETPWFRIECS